jgi:CRP/FNR family transcriptional regulator, cyclic AMP receptor protein
VFNQGDEAEQMYVVLDGAIDIIIGGKPVGTAEPGETFGEMALIDQSRRSGTAVAKSDCRLVPIDRRRFLFMVTETPNFALQLMGTLAERLRAKDDGLVGQVLGSDSLGGWTGPDPLSPAALARKGHQAGQVNVGVGQLVRRDGLAGPDQCLEVVPLVPDVGVHGGPHPAVE